MAKKKKTKKKLSTRTTAQKGNALEEAVNAIEEAILQMLPGTQGKTFKIESKKILVIDGVKHEIDLFVTLDLGSGYLAVFIFECKNWEDPVNKNEIIIFSEKLRAVGANHGYFIAKAFTKDAEAQAKKDNRITLRLGTEHDPINNSAFGIAWGVRHHYDHFAMKIFPRQGMSLPPTLESSVEFKYMGQSTDWETLLRPWSREAVKPIMQEFSSNKEQGAYPVEYTYTRDLSPGELTVAGADIVKMEVNVKSTVHIYHQPVISAFDVQSRGRVVTFAPMNMDGFQVSGSKVIMLGITLPDRT
jgi:hypothetical protein